MLTALTLAAPVPADGTGPVVVGRLPAPDVAPARELTATVELGKDGAPELTTIGTVVLTPAGAVGTTTGPETEGTTTGTPEETTGAREEGTGAAV